MREQKGKKRGRREGKAEITVSYLLLQRSLCFSESFPKRLKRDNSHYATEYITTRLNPCQ